MKYLRSPTELTSFNVYLSNVSLQWTICVKYLGVLIDNRLDWSSHVQLIKRKLYASNMLFKICKFVAIYVLRWLNLGSFTVTYNIALFQGYSQ